MVTANDILFNWDNVKNHPFTEEEIVAILVEFKVEFFKESFIPNEQQTANLIEFANALDDKSFLTLWESVTTPWNSKPHGKTYLTFLRAYARGVVTRIRKIVDDSTPTPEKKGSEPWPDNMIDS